MKTHKNFGLSQQETAYDNFNLGKNWDLGIISKKGIKIKQEAKQAETEQKRVNAQIMQQIAAEQTQDNDEGISAGVAITIGVIVVVGLLVGLSMMSKRRKGQEVARQEQPAVVNQIV